MIIERLNFTESPNPAQDGYPKRLTCPFCGCVFTIKKKMKGKEQKFCSPRCTTKWHSREIAKVREAGKIALGLKSATE